MLSAVLKSDVVVEVSIKIMNSFVEMRRFLISNKEMFARLDRVVITTAGKGGLSTKDITKFNAQYPKLSVNFI